jgi:uncharacterized membrane protein
MYKINIQDIDYDRKEKQKKKKKNSNLFTVVFHLPFFLKKQVHQVINKNLLQVKVIKHLNDFVRFQWN